jgi:hypothetical protein
VQTPECLVNFSQHTAVAAGLCRGLSYQHGYLLHGYLWKGYNLLCICLGAPVSIAYSTQQSKPCHQVPAFFNAAGVMPKHIQTATLSAASFCTYTLPGQRLVMTRRQQQYPAQRPASGITTTTSSVCCKGTFQVLSSIWH